MAAFDPFFDPYFDSQRTLGEKGALASLTVKTSEPIVVAAAGSSPLVPAGYRLVEVPSPSTGSLYVYGDTVRIVGALNLPGQAVEINARVVELATGSDGQRPAITVSGAPGAKPDTPEIALAGSPGDGAAGKYTYSFLPGPDPYTAPIAGNPGAPGHDGAHGKAGGNAGWVDIRAGSLVQIGGAILTIEANGGAGGAGQDGQPGQRGGNGGPGADAWKGGAVGTDFEEATNGADAGAGGPGGRGGPGGYGGSAGQINVYLLATLSDGVVTTSSVKGAQGPVGNADNKAHPGFADDGSNGTPGAGGQPFTYTPATDFGGHPTPVTMRGGVGGGVGTPLQRKAAAAVTADASADKTPIVVGSAKDADVAFTADGDQLAMLLNNVRTDYLSVADEADTLASMNARLKWLAVCGAAPATVTNAAAVKSAAIGILGNLLDPTRDAFGHTSDWAPLASLSQYDSLIGDTTSGSACVLQMTESAWSAYRDARTKGLDVASARTAALTAASNRITDLTKQRDDAWTQLAALSNTISNMANTVAAAKQDVGAHLASFVANVRGKVTLSFGKYLDVIEQTAFASSDPASGAVVGGTEQLKFWKSAMSDVTGDNGETVSKSYLVSRMDILGDKVKTLDEAYDVTDGYIKQRDQDAYKLLCTQDKLEELLDNYRSIDGAKEAEAAMTAYVRDVQLRNEKILNYNAQVSTLALLQGELDQLTAEHAKLGAAAAGNSLPIMDRFVQGLYDRARQDCITDLYEMTRAYRFWSLNDYNVFRDVLKCAGQSTVNYLAVSSGHQRIKGMKVDDVNKLVADLAARADPVVITFDAKKHGVIASLKKSRGADADGVTLPHFWQFSLTPATKASTAKSDHFTDMADVRLVEVRCWLIGLNSAADATGAVKIHLTQQGDETLANRQGDIVSVRHDPIEKTFEYSTSKGAWPSAGAVVTHATYWAPTPPNALPEHTPIGPFATWRVGLRPQDAAHAIQWDTLQSVRLEFFICWQGFDTSEPRH